MIRVVIIDNHLLVQWSIEMLLEKHPDIQVAATSNIEDNLLHLVGDIQPDVIILGFGARESVSVRTVVDLKSVCPEAKVLALISHDQSALVQPLLDAGVQGCFFESDEETLAIDAAVCSIAQGEYCHSPEIARHYSSLASYDLTPDDIKLLCLVAEGFSNKAIGQRLSVSPRKIGHRLSVLYRMLNLPRDNRKILRAVAVIHIQALGLQLNTLHAEDSNPSQGES